MVLVQCVYSCSNLSTCVAYLLLHNANSQSQLQEACISTGAHISLSSFHWYHWYVWLWCTQNQPKCGPLHNLVLGWIWVGNLKSLHMYINTSLHHSSLIIHATCFRAFTLHRQHFITRPPHYNCNLDWINYKCIDKFVLCYNSTFVRPGSTTEVI